MTRVIHAGFTLEEKILAKTVVDQVTGCWVCQSAFIEGYGTIWDEEHGRTVRAHRAAYEIWRGPILKGLTLDHLCRNRACANPWHVEVVTNRENVLRGIGLSAQNARKTHCPRGHEYSPENTLVHKGKRYCRPCRQQLQRERRSRAALALSDPPEESK